MKLVSLAHSGFAGSRMVGLTCILVCAFLCAAPSPGRATQPPSAALASDISTLRMTETRPYALQRPEEDALLVAERAAHAKAMQAAMRVLVALPEVRIAGAIGSSPASSPNLLALAHATVKTRVLLVSRSKRDGTVTVTLAADEQNSASELEQRVRSTLLHPERLALYEEAALREAALIADYDVILARSERNGGVPLSTASRNELAAIVGELEALLAYAAILPLRGSVWTDPAIVRKAITHGLAHAPDSALLRNALGDLLLQAGRSQEAVEEQNRAIRTAPTFTRAYQSRGAAFMALGHLSSATADFSEAIRLSPQAASVYRDRGMAHHLLGESAAMCRDFYEACTLGLCEKFRRATEEGLCPPAPH